MHPLEGGIFRRKYRRDRRPGLPLENPLVFYAKYGWEIVSKHVRFVPFYLRYRRTLRRVMNDMRPYSDLPIARVRPSEVANLELFTATAGGLAARERQRRRQDVEAAARVE